MNNRKLWVSILAGILALIMILSLFIGVLPGVASAYTKSELEQQIAELQKEKEQYDKEISGLRSQLQDNLDSMEATVAQKNLIDQEIFTIYQQIENLNEQIAAYNLLIAEKQQELDEAEARLAELNEKNKERIRAMEEDGTLSYWSVLFKANNFADLLDRLNMVEEIAAADQRRLKEMSDAAKLIADTKAALEAEKQNMEQTKLTLAESQKQLEEKRAEADRLLAELIATGAEYEALLDEAESKAAAIGSEIDGKEDQIKDIEYQQWLSTSKPPQQSPSGSGGSSGKTVDIWGGFKQDPISSQVQAVVDKVLSLLAPLMAIDLNPLKQALQSLGTAFSGLASLAGESLSYLWYEVLTPFAAWVMEVLAPTLTEGWAAAMELVTAVISPLLEGIRILWEALKPVVAFIGESVITTLDNWRQRFELLTAVFREKHPVIVGIFQNISQMATQLWSVVGPVLSNLRSHFSGVFGGISQTVGTAIGYILDMLYGLSTFLAGTFSGSWKTAWEGMRLFLRSAVNGVISLLNGMISRLVSALNSVVRAANKLSFTVPAWVPSIGGRRFGVNMSYVTAPQIPYLAKGAVLPAGKPFLAMVGDQRHGTNVEAPLSTIQEAVALVMEDQTGAILRGFEASIGVQREILEAVLGIRIGDDLIGQAVERYEEKMTIVRGW